MLWTECVFSHTAKALLVLQSVLQPKPNVAKEDMKLCQNMHKADRI